MKPAKISKSLLATNYLLIATSYLLLAKPLLAQTVTSSGLSAIPPRLEVSVPADGSNSQAIKVRNESNDTKTIKVTIRDFVVTDNKGTPNFIDDISEVASNRWAASSWIQISPSSLTLKPGETKSLTLTVLPPANALPGGHYAAVVYSPESGSIGSATGASVQTNVGTLVYVTVPGDINQKATIQSFTAPKFSEFGPIDFKATIKNSSDIHIQPVGSITIKNWLGGKTAQLALDQTNIFPYTTRDFQNTLDKKWLFGRYKATLNAVYGTAGAIIATTIIFWVIPWRLIILITAAIAIVTALIIVIKKKSKKNPKAAEGDVAQLEKELEELKKKYKDN